MAPDLVEELEVNAAGTDLDRSAMRLRAAHSTRAGQEMVALVHALGERLRERLSRELPSLRGP